MDSYLSDREYNLNVVDLIPYVAANAMNTSISILQVQNGQVSTLAISQETCHGEK